MTDAPKDSPSPASDPEAWKSALAWAVMDNLCGHARGCSARLTCDGEQLGPCDGECAIDRSAVVAEVLALIDRHAPPTLPPSAPSPEVARLTAWVADLLAGMYVNCVYCGHRYGPAATTPVSMADVLKAHVEQCPEHPMSALRREVARLEKENEELRARAEKAELEAGTFRYASAPQAVAWKTRAIKAEADLTSAREALRLTREWMLRELGHLEGCGYITEYAGARLRVALEPPAPVAPSEERTDATSK